MSGYRTFLVTDNEGNTHKVERVLFGIVRQSGHLDFMDGEGGIVATFKDWKQVQDWPKDGEKQPK